MRKTMALVLALLLSVSLWGCDSTQPPATTGPSAPVVTLPTEESQPQQTQPPETEPPMTEPADPILFDPEMLVGKWKFLADSTVDTGMTFTINADGTLIKEGWNYTWKAEPADPETAYEAVLQVKYSRKPGMPTTVFQNSFTLYLTRTPENTYLITLQSEDQGISADYYRVGDYEVLELTKDNALDYLQCSRYYTYSTTPSGYTRNIYCYTQISFREGVGAPSFFQGLLQYRVSETEVTFEPKPSKFTEGEVLRTYEDQPALWGNQLPKVTGRISYAFSEAYEWMDNSGGENGLKIIRFWEPILAEQVCGKVYIPIEK